MSTPANVLFVMTDQQRFDTIAALGNDFIHTPNIDRLVERGVACTNAYTQCPVCVPARENIRSGRAMPTTGNFGGGPVTETPAIEERSGPFLPRRMSELGYRTFGIGKFHTSPKYTDLGYDTHLHSEELASDEALEDDYKSWIRSEHPQYDHVEELHGERSAMYYMPQTNPLAAEHAMEGWATDRALEHLTVDSDAPFFGMVSFIGPHPPFRPPTPYNRLYDPRDMPAVVTGEREEDHRDFQIPHQNVTMWGVDDNGVVDDLRRRQCWARYCGEISYIDAQVGRLLDAVEDRSDAENTVICFFSDHGEHLGDHHAWEKRSFFEQSARIPFLVSWPAQLPAGERCDDLVCLSDLFGVATRAAGHPEPRDGVDLVETIRGGAAPREYLAGYFGEPGTRWFKMMIREDDWKYIYLSNGGREQLFDLAADPNEQENLAGAADGVTARLRGRAVADLEANGVAAALEDGELLAHDFEPTDPSRAEQFDYPIDGYGEFPEGF